MNKFYLKDLCSFQEGYVNPPQGNKGFFDGEIKWLRASDLNDGIVYNTERTLTEIGFKSAGKSAFMFKKDTIAISKSGTIGRLGILKDEMCGNRAVINIDVNHKLSNLYYIFYTLKYKKNEIISKAGGSIQKNLYVSSLETISLNHSDLNTQSQIAKVLSDLDVKIELNNKINAELEAMAKLIYDYWFVQFDFPISAEQAASMGKPQLEGKPYKSSGGKMVWNEELKREVPEGWEVKQLGDVLERTGTGLNPRDNFKLGEGNNYYVTIKSIEQGKIVLNSKCDRIDDEALVIINKRSDLRKGDILFTSIQPVGVTYLLRETPKNWNINESVFTIRPNYSIVSSEFLYMFLSGDYIKGYTNNVSAGSIHKGIRHTSLKECMFVLPKKTLIEKYTELSTPLLNKMYIIENENQKLAELRDWLLPMLMNGQVKVDKLSDQEDPLNMAAEERDKYR